MVSTLVRESNPAVGSWALELAVRGLVTQRQTRGCDHEFDPVGETEWS